MILWTILFAVAIVSIFMIEFEKWIATTLCLISTVGIYFWLSGTNLLGWITANWTVLLIYTGVYIVAGVIWSFAKWFFFLIGFRDKYIDSKEKEKTAKSRQREMWIKKYPNSFDHHGNVRAQYKVEYELFVDRNSLNDWFNHYYDNPLHKRPQVSENKSRIVAWISFWPFSLIGTLLNDPIRRLINWVFNRLKNTYQEMANSILKDIPEVK